MGLNFQRCKINITSNMAKIANTGQDEAVVCGYAQKDT